ncbi:MAG: metal ABC transporter ATP-binding protein, partial [Puniceicoccales bacterium]
MKEGANDYLEVEDLHVHFKEICAIRDVSFRIAAGQSVAIVGRNGAGKSTLLRSLAGLMPNAAGKIVWNGSSITKLNRRKLVAYLPQREEIDWSFPITVQGLVDMGLYPLVGNWARFRNEHREAAAAAIARMGLQGLEKRRIGELSGGQQQRAFLARAIAGGARILLFDEPFAGLDANAMDTLSGLIQNLVDGGALVLASHHDLSSIPKIFDHTLLLKTVQLAFGPTAEVLTPEGIQRAFGL